MASQPSQRNHPANRDAAAIDGWHELSVANPTFLLERLGSECTDLQSLRELTVNGLDAIAALGDNVSGRVVWDIDWLRFDASAGRVRKLSVTDTGTGMTPEQLRQYINQLASSGREQSAGNFGVGAKVAAGSRNPHGLEYRSWHEGRGSLVRFKRHPTAAGDSSPNTGRTDAPTSGDHSTSRTSRANCADWTTVPRSCSWVGTSATTPPRRWTVSPTPAGNGPPATSTDASCDSEHVEVLVRDPQGYPGNLQRIRGEQHHLQQRAIAAGAVQLSDAIAHWWVLDDDHRARRREGTIWASTGHAAAVYSEVLYDALPQTRGGYGRLQDFGVRFGYESVVLHLEPHVPAGRLQCNTARTLLLLDHEPLPWARWGEELVAVMPTEILRLEERAASADGLPRQQAIRNRVNAIMPLYQLSRYSPTRPPRQPSVKSAAGGTSDERAGWPATGPQARGGPPVAEAVQAPASKHPGHDGSDRELFGEPADHHPGPDVVVDLPDVAWISVRDGSRALGDLEDEAARYHLERDELTINGDFRAVTDLISHWQARYRGIAGARTVIEAQVREWCEQILLEVVLAARSSSWSDEQLNALLSPTSFTAALLPRHLLHATLQKRLAQKLGAPRKPVSAATVRGCAIDEHGDRNGREEDS